MRAHSANAPERLGPVMTARAWKEFYAAERAQLGAAGLERLLDRAPEVALEPRGALVFPHTRLESSGELVAAVALACVRARVPEVLALGVLHGAREADAALVARARAGEPEACAQLRRVHVPGDPGEASEPQDHTSEEFSLDGFAALLELAARREGRAPPRLRRRFPFLVGERPADLPGLDELRALRARGAALVATADPIHHGRGYGTPEAACLEPASETTRALARAKVARGFELLAARDHAAFLEHCAREKSDFRDPGPVLAELLGEAPWRARVVALALVDYARALEAPPPTWVAGALVAIA